MKTMSFFKSGSFCFLPGGYTTVIMEQTNCTQQPWCNLRQKPLTRRKPSPVCRHTMNSFQAANTQQYTVLGFHSKLVFSGRLENVPSKTTVSPPTKDSFVPPLCRWLVPSLTPNQLVVRAYKTSDYSHKVWTNLVSVDSNFWNCKKTE